ncbi:DUF58 domain-containing protein [Chromobacterium sp.]|uniref:DUF58 domain-containing protein n=1 Tax=Chromobacterium sp. TaxID=306190 RepID=UPI0035B26E8C
MFPFLDWRGRLRRWMLRRVAPQPHCRLEQNRIYLLPTRFGLTLCLVALAVWIGALNYDVSLAYALSFWVAGLLLVAVLMAYRQLAGLQLRALDAEPVFAGDVARFRVLLSHDDAGARLLNLALLDDAEAQVCRLPGGREFELELSVCGSRRGYMALPACQVWSEAPFGLVRASAWVRLTAQVLLFPAPLQDSQRGHSQGGGDKPSGGPGVEEDFSHLDAYRVGDSPRRIAWKVLARRDALVSKQFAGEGRAGLLTLDWQDYGRGGDVELKLSRLAWRVEQCERSRLAYVLKLPTRSIGPQPQQRLLALTALALHRERGDDAC